ncbi:MAG TPA: hypothetical protein PLN21_10910 [Gemmatales bacterium]|nr:hypothetical protein [Gemmatales bacterium]
MKHTTARRWLIALGLILGIACSVQAQGADIAKLFPDNTEMAFSFNVKSVLNSAVYQKHFKEEIDKRIKENAQLVKMMETLSFDPMKDITSVTFTVSKFNARLGGPPEADMFGVVKGAFNVEKLNGALGALIAAANQGDRVSTTKYGDFILYEVKDTNSGKTLYATIFDKETIIGGTVKEDVTNAIERLAGRKTGTLNAKFTELMGKARNDNTMWGAILIPSSVREMSKMAPSPEIGDAIAKLETQTMNLNVKDNVKFDVSMYMADKAAAGAMKALMDQAKDLAGAAALSNDQFGSELADLVSSLQIGTNENKVSLAGDIKAELVDKIVKAMKSR